MSSPRLQGCNPTVYSQDITFTATVSAISGTGTPTGTVEFTVATGISGPVALVGGTATFVLTTPTLSPGSYPVEAHYSGDSQFRPSSDSTTHTITKAPTETVLTDPPSVCGEPVTFTATVFARPPAAPGAKPTGKVHFTEVATAQLLAVRDLVGNQATFTTADLPVGPHTISAEYKGDANFFASQDNYDHEVTKADATVSLTSSINPSVCGELVTFTAQVTAVSPSTHVPGGTVDITIDNGISVQTRTATVVGGEASITVALQPGSYTVTAHYNGDHCFNSSAEDDSITQEVVKAETTTTVESSADPSSLGQPILFIATVSAASNTTEVPTGEVVFFVNGVPTATGGLDGNQQAFFITDSLTVGTHAISAHYLGDGCFNESESSTSQTVTNDTPPPPPPPPSTQIDLDIDSDNNDGLNSPARTNAEEAIEDNPTLPGKILLANTLDRTGNDVPDFADGINKFNNSGVNLSESFVPIILSVGPNVDLSRARIRLIYSAADPNSVSKSTGDLPLYAPGSQGKIRIWTTDGPVARRVASISAATPGDYVAPGVHRADRLFSADSRTVRLFVEGINESTRGEVRIVAQLDALGTGNFADEDAVRDTVGVVAIVYTDVTGLRGIGATPARNVPRIARDIEPDGIATDWMNGVNDGALLLMRVIGSPFLRELATANPADVRIEFGYIQQATPHPFASLPAQLQREGEFRELSDASFIPDGEGLLLNLSIATVGRDMRNGTRFVLDARFYKPPVEFDLTTPLNPAKERKLNLAIRVTGKVFATGSKPNAIYLVRPPLVLVHGVHSNPQMWEGINDKGVEDANAFLRQFDTGTTNFGFHAAEFRVDHSGPDEDLRGEGATLGFGEISHMYRRVPEMMTLATGWFRQGFVDSTVFFKGIGPKSRGKKIALQKVDIVAHSYGGLLSRWYIERDADPRPKQDCEVC